MKVKDLMTPDPLYCSPDAPLTRVAEMMREGDCGEIPVCDRFRVVGVITDRDITCRAVAARKNPLRLRARDIMTRLVVTTTPFEDIEQAIKVMEQEKVRRLPVIDQEKRLIGILSSSDIASYSDEKGGELLRAVSSDSLWKSKMRFAL